MHRESPKHPQVRRQTRRRRDVQDSARTNTGDLLGSALGVFLLWETVGQVLIQPMTDLESQIAAARSETTHAAGAVVNHRSSRQTSQDGSGNQSTGRSGESRSDVSGLADPAHGSLRRGKRHRHTSTRNRRNQRRSPNPVHGPGRSLNHSDRAVARHVQHGGDSASSVTSLNIANQSIEGAGLHRITLSIEALALANASDINALPEPQQPDSADSLTAILSSGDIFRRQLPVQVAVEPPPARLTPPTAGNKTRAAQSRSTEEHSVRRIRLERPTTSRLVCRSAIKRRTHRRRQRRTGPPRADQQSALHRRRPPPHGNVRPKVQPSTRPDSEPARDVAIGRRMIAIVPIDRTLCNRIFHPGALSSRFISLRSRVSAETRFTLEAGSFPSAEPKDGRISSQKTSSAQSKATRPIHRPFLWPSTFGAH